MLTEKIADYFEVRTPIDRVQFGGTNTGGKIVSSFKALWHVLMLHGRHNVYSSPPGQSGLWLFLMIAAAARCRGITLFVHHHTFRSICAGPLMAMRLLNWIGGRHIRHVFLGQRMSEGFARVYPPILFSCEAIVLPNAFAYPPPTEAPPPRSGPLTIGHLSVLTRQKGVERIIAIFDRLRADGRNIRMLLAGPIADAALRPAVDAAARRHGTAFEFRGPVYGAQKSAFYRELDLFLLPSSLIDEADPLVIQEAYEEGAEVMANDRGCIAERLRRPSGFLTLDPEEDYRRVAAMLDDIAAHRTDVATQNWMHARAMHSYASSQAEVLLRRLLDEAR
jgi:glycosyltransferase involved in cell wall biosynthesis